MTFSLRRLLDHFARSGNHRRASARKRSRNSRPWCETLEDRAVPTAISWANPNGGLWTVPGNWSPAQVPGPGDDVTINVAAAITVTLNEGAHTVQSLDSREDLTVTGSGTALTVTDSFTLGNDSSFTVASSGRFTSLGTTNVNGATVMASSGGAIDLPGMTAYEATGRRDISANNGGSRVSMPNVTLWRGPSGGNYVTVWATNGGVVELPRLAQVTQGDTRLRVHTAGRIELPALVSFTGTRPNSSWLEINEGSVVVPALTTLNMVWLNVSYATPDFPSLTNIDRCDVSVTDGGVLNLPLVTRYDNTGVTDERGVVVRTGGRLRFPNLTLWRVPSGSRVTVSANTGVVELPRLAEVSQGDTVFSATFTGSRIELPALTSFVGTHPTLSGIGSSSGGVVAVPALTTLNNARLGVISTLTSFPSLTNIDRSNIFVSGPGPIELSLPLVTSYDNTGLTGVSGNRELEARGSGIVLSFPNLTVWRGSSNGSRVGVRASEGGGVRMPQLAQVSQGDSRFEVNGNSWIDLPALTSFTGTHPNSSQLQVVGVGVLVVPALTTLNRVGILVANNTPSFPSLSNIDGCNLTVFSTLFGFRELSLPLVTSYNAGLEDNRIFEANGISGRLSFPNLTLWRGSSNGSYVAVQATDGGVVDLPLLTQLNQGNTRLIAQSPNSRVQVPALSNFVGTDLAWSRIEASAGGTVAAPALTTLNAVHVRLTAPGAMPIAQLTTVLNSWLVLSGGAPIVAGLTSFNRSSLAVSGGLVMTLPGLTSYDNTGLNASRAFEANGTNSRVNLPNLTLVRGGSGGFDVSFRALNGGVVDIPLLAQVTQGDAMFIAQGTNSRVQVPALTTLTGTDPSSSRLEAGGGGVVVPSSGAVQLTRAGVWLTSGGVVNLSTLQLNANGLLTGNGMLTANVISTGGEVRAAGTNERLTIAGTLHQVSGSVTGNGIVTVTGLLTWEGGSMSGNVAPSRTVAAGGLALAGSANKTLDRRTLVNQGAGIWTGTGNLILDNAAQLQNQAAGTIDAQSDLAIVLGAGVGQLFTNAGTFRKSAGVDGQFTVVAVPFTNTGTVHVLAGELSITGPFSNFADNTLTGGTYHVTGTFRFPFATIATNAANIVLDGPDSQILDQDSLDAMSGLSQNTAAGRFTVQNGRTFTTTDSLTNAGTFTAGPDGIVIVVGTYTQTAGRTVLDAGYLYTLVMFDLQDGVLDGTNRGILEADVRNAARIHVGGLDTAGEFYILGNYTQTATGHLDMELGGTNLGVDYDFLYVSGTMTLEVGSTLNISLLGAYRPNPDDPFELIYCNGGIAGDFTTITGLDLGDGLHLYPYTDGFVYYLFAYRS